MIEWRHWGDDGAARLRLICFGYAGGSASVFHRWSQSLPAGVALSSPLLPGRGRLKDAALFRQMDPLIDALDREGAALTRQPLVMFGHSMGALVLHAWARRMARKRNEVPLHFFASASRSPQRPSWTRPIVDQTDEELAQTALWLHSGEGRPPPEELVRQGLPLLRADLEVCQSYVPDPDPFLLPCPVTALAGLDDPLVSPEDADQWRQRSAGSFIRRVMPGGHFFLLHRPEPLLRLLSRELSSLLTRVAPPPRPPPPPLLDARIA